MNDIDSIFKTTLAKIEEEKVEALSQKEIKKQEDEGLKKRVVEALNNLSKIALEAFESGGDFFKLMIEKRASDYYDSNISRIIIANLREFDRGDEKEKHFRIFISVERGYFLRDPQTIADFENFKISCGYWWFCVGRLHVDTEIIPSLDLLHFIERINTLERFVETCTRANFH
jgi:hypothetical protein